MFFGGVQVEVGNVTRQSSCTPIHTDESPGTLISRSRLRLPSGFTLSLPVKLCNISSSSRTPLHDCKTQEPIIAVGTEAGLLQVGWNVSAGPATVKHLVVRMSSKPLHSVIPRMPPVCFTGRILYLFQVISIDFAACMIFPSN